MVERYRALSFWHDSLDEDFAPRSSLAGEHAADVAIVGAGYTGLWTAYYLKKAAPGLRIAIVESDIAGFGASGRNGGWCLGVIAGIERWLADPVRRERGIALARAMFGAVDEVGRVASVEGISCDFAKGGTISVATARPHADALRGRLEELRSLGFGEDDYRWLDPGECRSLVNTSMNHGGLYLSHCAAIHPAKLVRGLAEVVERLGVDIYEQSPARTIADRVVTTDGGCVRADFVVRATEGYTSRFKRYHRELLPIHTLMVATEPLPPSTWKEIGLARRETFGDPRRIIIYGQRTADDRLAFGGRGEYYFGSAVHDTFPPGGHAFGRLRRTLTDLFPVLRDVRITHSWGGPVGVPRNWQPSVGLDRSTGYAWAGGYVGEGVAASNLAGRTLAALILKQDSEAVRLPWVGRPFPQWEPEPARWAAVKALRALADSVDEAELNSGRTPGLRSTVVGWFMG
jgi:glycine/D-amino acid oxidase-like deaminating enzyme